MKARHFSGKGQIFLSSFDESKTKCLPNVLVQINGKWFACKDVLQKASIIEALDGISTTIIGNSAQCISSLLLKFDISLDDCAEDNAKATIRIIRKACKDTLKRTAGSRLLYNYEYNPIKFFLTSLRKDSPQELRKIIESTLSQLKKIDGGIVSVRG